MTESDGSTAAANPASLELRDLLTGLCGAAVLTPVELLALDHAGIDLWWVVIVLFASLGLAVGAVTAVAQACVRAWGLHGLPAATVLGAGSLIVTVPVARHLFDGAFASTLPGARWGFLWVPLGAWSSLSAMLLVGKRVATRPRGRRLLGAGLVVAVVAIEWVNRTVERSEYPDLHALLIVAACVAAGLAIRLLRVGWIPAISSARSAARLRVAVGVTVVSAFATALAFGLRDRQSRWAVARSGMHTRMLVRVIRAAVDLDEDGYAAVLGGPDCDDGNPEIHAAAREIPGNSVDEDCDGIALAAMAEKTADDTDRATRLAAWRASETVRSVLDRTGSMNLLLVAVDALRADVLEDTPLNRSAFPNTFGLLDESRTFSRAFAPSAGTDLSMSSLLTGRVDPFSAVEQTLAEAIETRGRQSYAVIPSEVLRYVGRALLTRGLDEYRRLLNDRFEQDVGSYTTSHRTTDLGLAFLDRWAQQPVPEPFFLWLHYFDVHEHDEIRPGDRRLRELADRDTLRTKPGKYRALVSLVDREIGRVRGQLEARGLWDTTVVVFVSDHGESLGEDDRLPINHGKFVYNALVHVPLAIRIPGQPGATLAQPVSLIDVYPTVLELLGVPPSGPVDGESLVPHLVDGAPSDLRDPARVIALNESDQFGLIRWPYKLMVRARDNLRELYDLEHDFAETEDLASARPELVAQLNHAYESIPSVNLDRTPRGRWLRERAAKLDR